MIVNIRGLIRSVLREGVIVPPDIPNSRTFWHGGNLDNMKDDINHAKSRYEYGPGLYLTTSYELAKDYAKGSRKLYMVTVENGNDISDCSIKRDAIDEFVYMNVISSKKKLVKEALDRWTRNDGMVSADIFLNIMLNESAVKPTNAGKIRTFLVESGVDYHVTGNIRYNGEMMVLFNMKKIVKVQRVLPTDDIAVFDL